ncbi:hypothetical protein QA808_11490 [Streptomyces sp. B21-089]|uniref:hypothetical protein n=1 Tax=Streptomyces sp. B21-089 TaxID=3039412 RepID=UPI002FF2814E
MTAVPGADELRMKSLLVQRGVHPAADGPAAAVPPMPAQPPTVHETATADEQMLAEMFRGATAPSRQPELTPGRTVAVTGNSGRLPDWRRGPLDLSKLNAPVEEEEPAVEEDEDQEEEQAPQTSGSRDLIARLFGTNEEAHARYDALAAKGDARTAAARTAEDKGDEVEKESDDDTAVEEADPAVAAPTTAAPAAPKKPATSKVKAVTGNSRLRSLAFNAAAAGIGWKFGLVDVLGRYLPYAEQAATGMVGLALAIVGGLATYRGAGYITRHPAVTLVLPFAPVVRIGVALGAAAYGHKSAAHIVAWINRYGQEWGLGADAASLLLTAGAMCGGLYWAIDRRLRSLPWPARLLVRIPLASALLATALYGPGN